MEHKFPTLCQQMKNKYMTFLCSSVHINDCAKQSFSILVYERTISTQTQQFLFETQHIWNKFSFHALVCIVSQQALRGNEVTLRLWDGGMTEMLLLWLCIVTGASTTVWCSCLRCRWIHRRLYLNLFMVHYNSPFSLVYITYFALLHVWLK